ncbi:DUF397 domain-containing protein [Streptomyces pinistramenti]|uniref:DUF397 domain-containing protein n=1 Tax=Streptomyces pinistramenti TaxID=2884812 RepID=UPI0027E59E6A|nr:DUF397 domain-containing protein [Streptomyces pinistramenti]
MPRADGRKAGTHHPKQPTAPFRAARGSRRRRRAEWVKSSYSDANGGDCVELSPALTQTHGIVPVRDSKNSGGPALIFPADGWASLAAAVKCGDVTTR